MKIGFAGEKTCELGRQAIGFPQAHRSLASGCAQSAGAQAGQGSIRGLAIGLQFGLNLRDRVLLS
jgi:hypothetical protein